SSRSMSADCKSQEVKVKQESAPEVPCPVANSRLTSGLLKIAGLLKEGGVCGIPTDTVYALAASCKNPQAIEKIYNIKVRMKYILVVCGISCIVQFTTFSMGPAYDRVGTKDSIMIRVPNHTVTGHLCDITGPLAITSANPIVASTVVNCLKIDEGELQKYSQYFLSFLCFHRNFLTQAHLTLSTGTITIVREGCVTAVKVQQIFDRVKSTMV
uniref:Threonylcarbamoyl-AMP synthase n=1 Tax=Sander lucioperca TaxID=283035 RepID=A0A8C9ZP30_SANLU